MKIEKMSLKSIKNVLSRSEMKNIMAGSGPGRGCGIQGSSCLQSCCAGFYCVDTYLKGYTCQSCTGTTRCY
jgi:hypothetical protein